MHNDHGAPCAPSDLDMEHGPTHIAFLSHRLTSRARRVPSRGSGALPSYLQGDIHQSAQLRRPVLPHYPIIHIPEDTVDVLPSTGKVEYVADSRV